MHTMMRRYRDPFAYDDTRCRVVYAYDDTPPPRSMHRTQVVTGFPSSEIARLFHLAFRHRPPTESLSPREMMRGDHLLNETVDERPYRLRQLAHVMNALMGVVEREVGRTAKVATADVLVDSEAAHVQEAVTATATADVPATTTSALINDTSVAVVNDDDDEATQRNAKDAAQLPQYYSLTTGKPSAIVAATASATSDGETALSNDDAAEDVNYVVLRDGTKKKVPKLELAWSKVDDLREMYAWDESEWHNFTPSA